MVGGDPYCCELLLHDHAQVGCVDENGWQEIHQVTHTHPYIQALHYECYTDEILYSRTKYYYYSIIYYLKAL